MSFFQELKRRNVFRVGIAYAIVAWLIMQVADVMIDNIGAPDWLFPVVLMILAIGFLLALFFAWAFELTPEGIKREADVDRSQSIAPQTGRKLNNTILVLMALAIVYLLFDKFTGGRPDSVSTPAAAVATSGAQPETEPAPDLTADSAAEAAPERQSVAVLPFDNRSPREEDEYFAEGIHDDLLTTLSRIGSLKVISRTSVLRYRDTELPIPEIASELGVATVMEGAVQRSGDKVRINVQLIDANTDEHLWAEIFDRQLTAENLFDIQSEISEAIADALQATLSPEEQERINTRPTDDLVAYDAYLRGRQLMATRNSEKLQQAIEEFRTAVTLDPGFALAWVGLSDSHNLLSEYGSLREADAVAVQEQALAKALAIDPDLGEAYASMSNVHRFHSRMGESEEALKKAIELNPNYAPAYQWYSVQLASYPTRADEQLALIRKATELDPVSPIMQLNLGVAYWNKGLVGAAERQLLRLSELHPSFSRTYVALAWLEAVFKGRFDEALRYVMKARENDPGSIHTLNIEAFFHSQLGNQAAVESTLAAMDALDAEHPSTVWANIQSAVTFGSDAALSETLSWALPRLVELPQESEGIGHVQLMLGDLDRARDLYLRVESDWTRREAWSGLLDRRLPDACVIAWVLERTGDEVLGADLRREATRYFEEVLPEVTEHVQVHRPELCHLANGDTELALTSLQIQLEHGHLANWESWHRLPLYDVLRDEPRYVALVNQRAERIAEQRTRVDAAGWSEET